MIQVPNKVKDIKDQLYYHSAKIAYNLTKSYQYYLKLYMNIPVLQMSMALIQNLKVLIQKSNLSQPNSGKQILEEKNIDS